MNVMNKVVRTAADFQALLDRGIEGPVAMVHLLKFKDAAEYPDGRDSDLSGAGAYAIYREQMLAKVAAIGGREVFSAAAQHLVLGEVDELWDEVLVVEFPSAQAFVDTISSPEMAEAGIHRRAGLAGQLLIAAS